MADLPDRIGAYRIESVLGAGGMGVVYRARHGETGALAALKTVRAVDARLLAVLRREIHALSRLQHPDIIPVRDHGVVDGRPWYAMDLLAGTTFASCLAKVWHTMPSSADATPPVAGPQGPSADRSDSSEPATPLDVRTLLDGPTRLDTEKPFDASTLIDTEAAPDAFRPIGTEKTFDTSTLLEAATPQDLSTLLDASPALGPQRPAASGQRGVVPPVPRLPAGGGQLSRLLVIVRRLCAPLAFLHGEGIVHGDMKPENVLLRSDDSPVLGDFGLAVDVGGARGREILTVSAGIRGTVAYMAPEQILSGQVDARTDLYALGCILYEALVGRPPFVGPAQRVLYQHIHHAPLPPSRIVSGIPDRLEPLVLRLLAKQPRERIGYADDLAKMLGAFLHEPSEAAHRPRPQAYLYRSELAGRQRELRRLERLLEHGRHGTGLCAWIGGESGVGKTRFAAELGLRADSLGFQVITGQCIQKQPGSATVGLPLQPLRPFLRTVADRCREKGPGEVDRLLGRRGPVLALYEPSLALAAGEATWPEPARLAPDAARRRLLDYLLQTFEAMARERALLLILDDLQWCDELTLAFLRHLSGGRVHEIPLCVLGTYRTEELDEGLGQLVEMPDTEVCMLDRLDQPSIGQMVADMLALDEPPGEFIRFLFQESEGNPFFVAEYLRTAVATEVLQRDEHGGWRLASVSRDTYESLELPHSLAELVALRLEGLSRDGQQMVEIASVLGRELETHILERATGLGILPHLEAVQELLARQVLETAGSGKLRFLHHKLREITYADIIAEQRQRLHRRAAAAIEGEATGRTDLEKHADLGHHRSLGGEPEKALHHYRSAGALATEISANTEAIHYYRSALEQIDRPGSNVTTAASRAAASELQGKLGAVLALVGRQAEARQSYKAAIDHLTDEQRLAHADLQRGIGKTWEIHHEHAEALRGYAAAAEQLGDEPFAPTTAWWKSWVEVRLDRAWVHYWRAETKPMQAQLELVRRPLEDHGTALQRARFFDLMANLGHRRERYRASRQTVDYSRQALEASREAGDQVQIAEALFELGFAQFFHGDLPTASETLADALSEAKRIGDLTRQVRSLTYLTWSHRRARRQDLVAARAAECLQSAEESGIAIYVATSLAHLAWVDWHLGEHASVERRCREALATWHNSSVAFAFRSIAALPLSSVLLARDELAEPLDLIQAALAPSQGRLSDELSGALHEALELGHSQQHAAARESLERAIVLADETGYL
ncbi:MAG: AAA family ATPase [Acidobacteriota bacterium]